MSDIIEVLPADVVDQIAAGEVIERPASVVKELVDNAIDAGARLVSIDCTAGGRGGIRVSDDGCGMSRGDAVRALERFATSKLRAADELWTLATMGFRGEALPAIAAVARVVITTRRAADLAGTRVEVHAGRVTAVDEVGAPQGTTVDVTELFHVVPARLKFLKAEATEASHVTDWVNKVALAHPALHVRLRHDGRVALELPPDRDGLARVRAVAGPRVAAQLVHAHGEEAGARVAVYLAPPELAQTTARGVQLFVGRRPVRDRGLLHAIAMGYGELVPRGRYPVAFAMLDVAAGAVDVNVHPQKLEVRFADAGATCAAVRHVVQTAVARAPWHDEQGAARPIVMTASVARYATPLAHRMGRSAWVAREARAQPSLSLADTVPDVSPRAWVRRIKDTIRDAERAEAPPPAARQTIDDVQPALATGSGPIAAHGYFAQLRYLGQLDLTYLACEGDGELVLVDQHVAHERATVARLRAGGERDVLFRAPQRMLFPATVDVGERLVEIAAGAKDVLARVGYEIDVFGKTALAVKATPGSLRDRDPAQLLRALLAEWADGRPPDVDRALVELACHSALRAGERLTAGEAEALLRSLDDAAPAGAHNGRPMLLRLPIAEIGRRFGR
jgi:DNA mismatch repair protein MutL